MKKYLSLIVLCATSLIYGDGFENLKALQNQFHGLIYNAGDLGAATSAPEVPYIAGLLTNPVESIGESEDCHIYEFLYDKFSGRNRKAVRGIDEAKADAFNAINFRGFEQYRPYQNSGHSVFGIAAQEQPIHLPKVVINRPAMVASPMSMKPAASGIPMGLLAGISGGANPFAKVSLNKVSPTDKSASTNVSSSAAAVKPLHNRVQDYITTLKGKSKLSRNESADLAILQELESELSSSSSATSARYDDLVEFFGYLENPPAAPATQAKVGQLRMKLKPKDVVAFASTIPEVATSDERVSTASLLAADNPLLNRVTASGTSSQDPMLIELEKLKEEKDNLVEDEDSDWSDDDEKQEKTQDELQAEKTRITELDAQILILAEDLAKRGIILDDSIEASNERLEIYQRIKAHLEDQRNTSGKVYQQVNAKIKSQNGNMQSRSSSLLSGKVDVGSPPKSTTPPLPLGIVAVSTAAVNIDAWAEQEFERRKNDLEAKIKLLEEENVNALAVSKRMERRNTINGELNPLKQELARYNSAFAKNSIISEIKKSYPG